MTVKEEVLELLKEEREMSQSEIPKRLGRSKSSVSTAISQLQKEGELLVLSGVGRTSSKVFIPAKRIFMKEHKERTQRTQKIPGIDEGGIKSEEIIKEPIKKEIRKRTQRTNTKNTKTLTLSSFIEYLKDNPGHPHSKYFLKRLSPPHFSARSEIMKVIDTLNDYFNA